MKAMKPPSREAAEREYEKDQIWLRMADGDTVLVAVVGESHVRRVVWTGNRTEPFDPEKHAGQRPNRKESFNVVVKTPNGLQLRVFENSKKFWDMVAGRWKKFGTNRWYELERQGEGPKTNYVLDPNEEITPDEMAEIDRMELFDLEALMTPREDDSFEYGANAE